MAAPASHRPAARAFSLIELLVVISITALLIGILLPALARARKAAQVSASASNQRQILIGMSGWAIDRNGRMMRGPSEPQTLYVGAEMFPGGPTFPANLWHDPLTSQPRPWSGIASNQIYISSAWLPGGSLHTGGLLLDGYLTEPRVLFSPGDDSNDPSEELKKVQNRATLDLDAFCSYFFRQLDQTSKDLMEDLGQNGLGSPATALVMDANNVETPDETFARSNHEAREVTVGYLDGHVAIFPNPDNIFALTGADSINFPQSTLEKLDEMFVRADYGVSGNPADAPVEQIEHD